MRVRPCCSGSGATSGTDALVNQPSDVSSGTTTFATTATGAPTSYSEISAVESNEEPGQEPYDVPGSYAEYRTGPVTISTSPSTPGVLRLPVAGTGSYGPVVYAHAPGTSVTRGCPQATGRLSATALGKVRLGMTRRAARQAFTKSSTRRRRYQDYFRLKPSGIRVKYPSATLLRSVPRPQRRHLQGRVIVALTADRHYALRGVHPGARLRTVARRLHVGRAYHVGRNFRYLAPYGRGSGSCGASPDAQRARHRRGPRDRRGDGAAPGRHRLGRPGGRPPSAGR
jgi:hypothetical protein